MAYMGRGGISPVGNNNVGANGNINVNGGRRYYRGGIFRIYYYIPLDNTYVLFQMIATILIFIVAGITFLVTYKPSVVDPLEGTKGIIINTYLIITISLAVITFLVNYFSKDKNTLIKRLVIIVSIALITILVIFGIKAYLNSTYTKDKFEQIYVQENGETTEKTTNNKSKLSVGLSGMQVQTEKEYYVDECIKAYNIFSIRLYGVVALNVLLIILLIYGISKVSKIQDKEEQMSRDDAVLFDEEQDIKI